LLQAVVVVFGVLLLVFLLAHIVPGGPARAALGQRATAANIAAFDKFNGYDLPIWDQLWQYLVKVIVHQNLGFSYQYNQEVSSLISQRLPRTLLLVGLSTLLTLIIAIPLGILQVVRRNTVVDYFFTAVSFVLYAMPTFFVGFMIILLFALKTKIFTITQPSNTSVAGILEDPRFLIPPVLTLAAITVASFSRYMRSAMMDTLTQDYIRTARAKGAGPRRVLYRHALRNALIPIVTLLGLAFPMIVSGAVITETVFNFPGMGLLTVNAATQLDIPTLLGTTLAATVATVAGSFLADLLYAVVDPRIRYG
jgi:peptide/nickel transport system permease protein